MPSPNFGDRLLVNLEVKRGETLGQLNELFRRMAQLKEELELVEQQIQVGRGVMDGLEQAQLATKELVKGDQIADFQEGKEREMQAKDKEAQEIIAVRKAAGILRSESKTSVPGTKEFVGGGSIVGEDHVD